MAAAWWSLLLSPLFGAILLDRNWRALGKHANTRWSMTLACTSGVALAAGIASALIPTSVGTDKAIAGGGKLVGLVLTAACFGIARSQRRFLAETGRVPYPKRPWGKALGFGFAGLGALVCFVLAAAFLAPPGLEDVARETRRLMVEHFRNAPREGVSVVSSVRLDRQHGHDYVGSAEFLMNGQRIPVVLRVHLENDQLQWMAEPQAPMPTIAPAH